MEISKAVNPQSDQPIAQPLVSVPMKGEMAKPTLAGEVLSQVAGLQYPVLDHDALIGVMSPCRVYYVRGAEVDTSKIAQVPAWLFPFTSPEDLENKLQRALKLLAPTTVRIYAPKPCPESVEAPIATRE